MAKKKVSKKSGRPAGSTLKSFVFVGDLRPGDMHNPDSTVFGGYEFVLNGDPVKVSAEVAAKLSGHSHFTEK